MTEEAEYQSRLWVGVSAALVVILLLFLDPAPAYPCLLALFLVLGPLTLAELYRLMPSTPRQPLPLAILAVATMHLANWCPHSLSALFGTVVAVLLGAFSWEILTPRVPQGAIIRVALTTWMALYLGLLPSFLVQLRWKGAQPEQWFNWHGAFLVSLAVFIPKAGDVGAYYVGKTLGRHKMTPMLSPKKTWEGFVGGLLASVGVALIVQAVHPLFSAMWLAAAFGLTVSLAGVFGDLAESLIKRDAGQKDASATVPGFGGLLDVIDSVLFAAPVAYLWLR